MKRFICAMTALVLFGFSGAAQAASSLDLIENARSHDGTAVAYEGEVIGEILDRGANVWLNVYDGGAAIAVWAVKSQAAVVGRVGHYHQRGDCLHIEGIFHRACPEHGGTLDIHAASLTVTIPGSIIPERLSGNKILSLVILLGVLSCLLMVHLFHGKRAHR